MLDAFYPSQEEIEILSVLRTFTKLQFVTNIIIKININIGKGFDQSFKLLNASIFRLSTRYILLV